MPILHYNIAGRATQSNSVYVSVLQISTVLTDAVSKSLCQKFFFHTSSHCQRWEKYYISLDWWIQRLGSLVSKQTQFSGFFSWARVFKWGRKREKQRRRKLSINAVTIRFTDRKTLWIKPIPILLNISLTANNHFWYCCPFFASDSGFMHNSTGYVIKQLVHAFSCALSSYGALGKFGEHSRS